MSSGRRVEDNCDVMPKIDSPSTLYCHRVEPLVTLIKGYGSYTIPRVDVQFSATYQSKPGPLVLALYTATNAEVAPSLGRNLAGAAPSIDLHLLSPGIYNQGDNSGSAGELAGDRLHQVDLRISKLLRFGGARARANVDLYNAVNSNAVLLQNDAWDSWQTPEEILLARFFKFSVQWDF